MNINTKNAKKVYASTVNHMAASAKARMIREGIISIQPAKTVTKEYINQAYDTAFKKFELLSTDDYLSAKKLLGTPAANKLQRNLHTNKRSLIPSTKH